MLRTRIFDGVKQLGLRIFALQWAGGLWICILFVLQNYLTDVWKLSFTHAAAILNIWGGLSRILPVCFLFLADEFLGNFAVLILSGLAYTMGMALLTLSTPPVLANLTETCKQYEPQCVGHTQRVVFYTGMACLAVATAAHRACLNCFLKEQDKKAYDPNMEGRNWLKASVIIFMSLIPAIGIFSFPYIKKWFLLFGISTGFMAFATLVFLSGASGYSKCRPKGSAITITCRVFVAAASKTFKPWPLDAKMFYRKEELTSFTRSRFLRPLEKAAVILPSDVSTEDRVVYNGWRLCSLEDVEYAKSIVRMVPMWTTFMCCGIVSSIGNTYFVEQGSHMDRKLGKWTVPSQILLAVFFLGKKFFSSLAGRMLDASGTYRPSIGIAVSMVFAVFGCTTAGVVEMQRLKVITRHGLLDKPDEGIPMSAYWLFFQFFLLAGLDSFFERSVAKLIESQVPLPLIKYLRFFHVGVSGVGYMFGVLSVYVVGIVSEKVEKRSWIQDTMNRSHLDRYYWLLAVVSFVNLLIFIFVASFYRYRVSEEDIFGLDYINDEMES